MIVCTETHCYKYNFVFTSEELEALQKMLKEKRINDPLPEYRATILKVAAKNAITSVMENLPTEDYLKLSKVYITRASGKREVRLETKVKGYPWNCKKDLSAEIYTSFSNEELQKAIDEVIEEFKVQN